MQSLIQDLRYALRMFAKNPGFTAIAILTLAIGIGANTAIFSVVDAVLLRPLPFAQSDRMYCVYQAMPEKGVPKNGVSYPNYQDFKRLSKSFEELVATRDTALALTGQGDATYIVGQAVTGGYFEMYRQTPLLGRTLQEGDDSLAASNVVVVSERLWRSRFGSDPNIVGKTITLERHPFTVVGVVSADFRPGLADQDAELWVPLEQDRIFSQSSSRRGGHYLTILGRLKAGVTGAQAQAELTSIEEGLEKQFPDDNKGWSVRLIPIREDLLGDVRPALLVLLGAVGLVFLIACANVANLQLARAASRTREVAVRMALGAGRSRLVRQFFTECVLLGIAGGIAGLALAYVTVQGLKSWIPADVPRVAAIHTDARVLAFGLALSILSGIVFGLAPASRAGDAKLSGILNQGARAGEDARRRRLRAALVVAETALAVVLLIGAGLLIRSFSQLQHVNAGLNASQLVIAQVGLPLAEYSKPEQWNSFQEKLVERLNVMPGAEDATVAVPLPLVGGGINLGFEIEGKAQQAKSEELNNTDFIMVNPSYFRTMQIPLVRGREFTTADTAASPTVCLISTSMARRFFPNEDPIGKRITIGFPKGATREIVGVVGDVRDKTLADLDSTQLYVPFAQNPLWAAGIAVRGRGDVKLLGAAIREQVRVMDPSLPVTAIMTMADGMSQTVAQPRFRTTLLGLFGATALLLAAIGIYGVISYNTEQRTREIGIRIALGAQTHDVLRLVVGEGALLAIGGVALGLAGGAALTRFLQTLVFEVSVTDPFTFGAVALTLVGVGLAACYVPARRAMRVDPMVALRYE